MRFANDDRDIERYERPVSTPSVFEAIERDSRSRRTRRLVSWITFGILGLALGGVWAAGFVETSITSNDGGAGDNVGSPLVFSPTVSVVANSLSGKVTKTGMETFTVTFSGKDAQLNDTTEVADNTSATMYEVDLSGTDVDSGDVFFLTAFVTASPTNISVGQLTWSLDNTACASADFSDNVPTGATASTLAKTMDLLSSDAEVVFTDIGKASSAATYDAATGNKWCLGIFADNAKAKDSAVTPYHALRRLDTAQGFGTIKFGVALGQSAGS